MFGENSHSLGHGTAGINGFSGFTTNCLVDPLDPAVFAGKISVNDRSIWLCDSGVLDNEIEHYSYVRTE